MTAAGLHGSDRLGNGDWGHSTTTRFSAAIAPDQNVIENFHWRRLPARGRFNPNRTDFTVAFGAAVSGKRLWMQWHSGKFLREIADQLNSRDPAPPSIQG